MAPPLPADALGLDLAAVPGTVSVWLGRPGSPWLRRLADERHYAASTMKVAVLAAAYRCAEAGRLDLDAEVPVDNSFASAAAGAPRYECRRDYDNDDAVWERVGGTASLRWLLQRMIVRSSNLAANLVLERVGLAEVARVWSLVGARGSVVGRGIEDAAGAAAGHTNLVTAADLAALFTAVHDGAERPGPLATLASCRAMLDTLLAQQSGGDLAAGLPAGTRVAHKNGWIEGVRHAAGIVYADDAAPFILAVCLTTPLARSGHDDEACQLVASIAAAAWTNRHGP